jgi:hypothetical protein
VLSAFPPLATGAICRPLTAAERLVSDHATLIHKRGRKATK